MKQLYIIITFTCILAAGNTFGQSVGRTVTNFDPPASQYFLNQYLANPAMAGIDSGFHINASYRRPWDNMPGAPVTGTVTVDGTPGKRVGVGLNVLNDKAGLIQRTKVGLTYAYHLPLDVAAKQELHFGLSLAFETQRLDLKNIDGEQNDPTLGQFNRRDNYFDADFGMAYTNQHLTLQAAIPNLIGFVRNQDEDRSGIITFFSAAAYRFDLGNEITAVEPKVSYRGLRHQDNILDAGLNVILLNNWANVFGMYHSTGNYSIGAGVNYKSLFTVQGVYITQTSGYSTIMSNNFEVDLKINLFR